MQLPTTQNKELDRIQCWQFIVIEDKDQVINGKHFPLVQAN
jgi:hypothetical protein